jgi:prolyl-tRNA editing enzyme YbaK/EbsC (Cys-tRNA(Pro) deacylase)
LPFERETEKLEKRLRGYPRLVSERAWPQEVERVATFLREAGVESRVEEFSDGTPTAEDAARAVGCELGQIVKSLVFDCDGRSIVVLVPGDRRADKRKIAEAAGCGSARIATPDQVVAATGFAPGAVAPFPLQGVDRVLADRSLLQHPLVWIGAGSTRHMAAVTPADLVRLARAEPMDAVERHT